MAVFAPPSVLQAVLTGQKRRFFDASSTAPSIAQMNALRPRAGDTTPGRRPEDTAGCAVEIAAT